MTWRGDSYSAQALAAGTPTPLTPGGQVTIGGTTFTWPNVSAGALDNVVANGQTVQLSGSGSDLGILAPARTGRRPARSPSTTPTGPASPFTLNMADWYSNAPADRRPDRRHHLELEPELARAARTPVSVYFASVPLAAGKTVASVTLPSLPGSFGQTEMHIFADGHRLGHADELTAGLPGGPSRVATGPAQQPSLVH